MKSNPYKIEVGIYIPPETPDALKKLVEYKQKEIEKGWEKKYKTKKLESREA